MAPLNDSPSSGAQLDSAALQFPHTALLWKNYDGARFLAAFLFALSAIYFVYGFFAPQGWFGWVISRIPLLGSAFGLSCFLWRLSLLTLGYFFLWFTFDRKAIAGYAIAALPFLFASIYLVAPIDFIPDVVPVMGQVDDLTICLGSLLVGTKLWKNVRDQAAFHGRVSAALRRGDKESAFRLLVEEYGLHRDSH